MKWRYGSFVVALFAVFFISIASTHASLELRGTDSLGNRLIYDSDLNITWYDYTKYTDTWQNQMNWASGLTVNFGGNVYNDWRLPATVDGPAVYGYDGTTTYGLNITSSEIGHLFYTELDNNGMFDTSGQYTGCGMSISSLCLTNTGDFRNLQSSLYWSDTEYAIAPDNAWFFSFRNGSTEIGLKSYVINSYSGYAIAVHPGDVAAAVVPEPISSILFVTGGTLLAGGRFFRRKV